MVYSFGDFRVKVAERELWQRDTLLSVNRYVFDSIAYLIDHRDRAVGRDELVAAVWGRVDVSEGHLNQVIARGRRVLGDDAQTQRFVRTVPGFGYRWVGDVEVVDVPDGSEGVAIEMSAQTSSTRPQTPPRPHLPPWAYAALGLALALGGGIWLATRSPGTDASHSASAARDMRDTDAVVVLPIEVRASPDAGWLELGAMDLIAERLRSAGLRVSPSKTVVTALYGADSPVAPNDHAGVRAALGAGLIVQGSVSQSARGWAVQLSAQNAGGATQKVEARRKDAIQAARAATDLLLVALGRQPPGDDASAGTDAVQERLQQAQAASLTNQLELARTILVSVPEESRALPEVRLRLAELDFLAGRLAQSSEALETLLADPTIEISPIQRGRAMILRGNLKFRRSDFAGAVRDLDVAVEVLEHAAAPLDLCDALTRRGLARTALLDLDGGSADYSRARVLADQAGDRLRVAHVEAGFGLLQIERRRLDLALPYLDAAMSQYEALGVVERGVTLRQVLNDTYASLLNWPEVLRLSDRQWALRDRIGDPGLALTVVNRRVRLLIALGRYREAQEILADARGRYAGLRPESLRYLHDLQADLASHLGRPQEVIAAVDAALEKWPRDPSYDRYAYLILLRQRALIATGRATPSRVEPWLPEGEPGLSAVFWIARGEWAQQQGDAATARRDFDHALAVAEEVGKPDLVLLVAQSYVDWLLPRGEHAKAAELAGRVAIWVRHDFDCALLRVKVFHALGVEETWSDALEAARSLAGERTIPAELLRPPVVR